MIMHGRLKLRSTVAYFGWRSRWLNEMGAAARIEMGRQQIVKLNQIHTDMLTCQRRLLQPCGETGQGVNFAPWSTLCVDTQWPTAVSTPIVASDLRPNGLRVSVPWLSWPRGSLLVLVGWPEPSRDGTTCKLPTCSKRDELARKPRPWTIFSWFSAFSTCVVSNSETMGKHRGWWRGFYLPLDATVLCLCHGRASL